MVTVREILVRVRMEARAFVNGIKTVEYGLIKTREHLDRFRMGMFKLGAIMAKNSMQFQGWAMSLMFFGMAIQRTFSRVMMGAVSAFTRIVESSGQFGTAIQQLAVHWEYLKFVLGSAINRFLEPLMPTIINIINAVSEWIQKHPRLTSILLIGGLVLGTVLMLFGMFWLAIVNGVIPALIKLGPILGWVGKTFLWVGDKAIWLGKLLLGTGALGGAILGLVSLVLYLGIKWDWQWKAMVANAIVWGLEIVKWIVKIGAMVFGGLDILLNGLWDAIKIGLNWIVDAINELIDKFASIEVMGARPFAWLEKLRLSKFEIDSTAKALQRFADVQAGIDEHFAEKIAPWKDVLAEWSAIQNQAAPVASAATAESATSEAPTQPVYIQEINVNSDAVSAEQLIADLKRYAVITNTKV